MSGRVMERFRALGIDARVALGGDGSIAKRLMERGLPRVIGVPKTIDNDLRGSLPVSSFDRLLAHVWDGRPCAISRATIAAA